MREKKESEYADLLRSLGFEIDEDPDEFEKDIKDASDLPTQPVYGCVLDDDEEIVLMTFVLDEVGEFWVAEGNIDLSVHGFETYEEYRARVRKRLN